MGIAKGWIVYLKVSSVGKKQRNLNYFCKVSALQSCKFGAQCQQVLNQSTSHVYLPGELVSEYQYNSAEITREINLMNK